MPNGAYDVILKFAEPMFSAPNQRLFNVAINGSQVLTNFDIFAQAGASLTAVDETFPVTVTGGQITIQFSQGAADQPMVNALEITQQ